MKTLGQIAETAWAAELIMESVREVELDEDEGEFRRRVNKAALAAAAKAVATTVRAECLAAIEAHFLHGEAKYAVDRAHDEAVENSAAAAIRSLALEAP